MQTHSQSILTPRVQTAVNSKGDTLIEMKLADAKLILSVLLEKQYVDSIVSKLQDENNILNQTITLQVSEIRALQDKCKNQEVMSSNLTKITQNKDDEINLLNETIKAQKKEIRKQKFQKFIGFSVAVIVPIITILFLVK